MKIVFDLDDTLIDTYKWWEAAWLAIADEYTGISKSEGNKQRLREFYLHFDNLPSTYDFHGHLSTLGLIDKKDSIHQLIRRKLRTQDLCYDGVPELLDIANNLGEVVIVTYGMEYLQRTKILSCPMLESIELISTLSSKPELMKQMKQENADIGFVIVDDANMGEQLQNYDVDFIWATWSATAISRNQRKGLEPWPIEARTPKKAADLLLQKAA